MGEIILLGSSFMKGYYKDTKATSKAFKDEWFLTGDAGVAHADGYLEIKDRFNDVIISGGENISSVLYTHPRVLEAAVVAMPHPKWGESPCAFIALKDVAGKASLVNEAEIISKCRKNLPDYIVVPLPELPKTPTGKILELLLRETAKKFV